MARLLLLWFALLTSVASQGPCPTDSGVHGYTSIISINNAMKLVLNSIESGGQPKPAYIYTLCPRTVINTDQALTPVLSGAEFICGANGDLSDVCVIEGGANQVLIENSKVTGYSVLNVTFKGITFSGSSQSSVVAGAGSKTVAYFIDCKWVGFAMNSAVTLFLATGRAMTVIITGGVVQNGTAVNIFKNNNGTLEINGLTVADSVGQAAIETSLAGLTTVKDANFTSNNYVTLISTGQGSSLSANDLDVTSCGNNLQQLFYADGTGAVMNLTGVNIHDNAPPSTFWDAFTYAQGAKGGVYNSRIERNIGLEFGVDVHEDSVATVDGTTFESNIATTGGFSAVLYALNNSRLSVFGTNVTHNSGFNVYGFTGFKSFTQYDRTTFQGGSVVIAVFIDQDSTVAIHDIFFINVESQACPPPNQREFVEDVGSHCYYRGPGKCTGKCGVAKNNTIAPTRHVAPPTPAPFVAGQTPSPSPAPVAGPPSTAPHAPAIFIPTKSPVTPTMTIGPASPLASLSPTFMHSGEITFAPIVSSFAPTGQVTKQGKKGKKSNKKAKKTMEGKTGQKGKLGIAGKNAQKRKKTAKSVAGTETPIPVVSLSSPVPSLTGTAPLSSTPATVSPESSPAIPQLSPGLPSMHANPSLATPVSQTVSPVVPTAEPQLATPAIGHSQAPVGTAPSLSPAVRVEPPHLLKKIKTDEKGAEKLVKKDESIAINKLVNTQYRANVFERDRPESSRRRGARGL